MNGGGFIGPDEAKTGFESRKSRYTALHECGETGSISPRAGGLYRIIREELMAIEAEIALDRAVFLAGLAKRGPTLIRPGNEPGRMTVL